MGAGVSVAEGEALKQGVTPSLPGGWVNRFSGQESRFGRVSSDRYVRGRVRNTLPRSTKSARTEVIEVKNNDVSHPHSARTLLGRDEATNALLEPTTVGHVSPAEEAGKR